jgi:RNA polymerase sigma-70 factor (ECF subfamily)
MTGVSGSPACRTRRDGNLHQTVNRSLDRVDSVAAEALLAAVAESRDRQAFARLFAIYAPRVKGQLMARGAAAGIAEELTQEVMLTIWRKADRFDPARGAASTWIFAITRNCLLNQLRGRRYPVVEDDDPELTVASGQGPEEALSSAQDEWEIGEALARLPDEQREVLRGAYFRGRTMRELADEQRVALGTVKTRVRLALDRLRQMLKGRDGP